MTDARTPWRGLIPQEEPRSVVLTLNDGQSVTLDFKKGSAAGRFVGAAKAATNVRDVTVARPRD